MTKTIEDLFVYLASGSDVLISILLLIYIRQISKQKELVAILIYCSLAVIINKIIDIYHDAPFIDLLYGLFTFVEFVTFSFILWLQLQKKQAKKVLLLASVLFLLFIFFYYVSEHYRSIDSIPIGVETIIILIACFYYFFEQMNDTTTTFIYSKYGFWIISGIMLYLAGAFFMYIFANQVDSSFLVQYWFLTNAFYIIKNILFGVGILLYIKSVKNSPNKAIRPLLNFNF